MGTAVINPEVVTATSSVRVFEVAKKLRVAAKRRVAIAWENTNFKMEKPEFSGISGVLSSEPLTAAEAEAYRAAFDEPLAINFVGELLRERE